MATDAVTLTPDEGAATDGGPDRQTFDQALANQFRKHIHDAISEHPELRSVAVVFDYNGSLNDAGVLKGVWQGENGPVSSIPAVAGSIANGLAIMNHQTQRLVQIQQALRAELVKVSQELVQRRQDIGESDDIEKPADSEDAGGPAEGVGDNEVGPDSGR
jgi:hypothetical protein